MSTAQSPQGAQSQSAQSQNRQSNAGGGGQGGGNGAKTAREDPETKYGKFASGIKEEVARNQLRTMLCKKDTALLEKSVERFNSEGGTPTDKDELSSRANEELEYLKLRDELYAAMNARDLDQLLDVTKRIEEQQDRRFKNPLTADMMLARKLICMLNRSVDLPEKLDFDDKTMRELAQFSSPPVIVHDVVIAAFLLLGEYEGHTRNWVFCRDMLRPYKSTGKGGLRYRVENFNPETVNEEIAGRAKEIIDAYKITDVFRVSESAASLYVWTRSKLEEAKAGEPAKLKRQREILNVELPSEQWKPRKVF